MTERIPRAVYDKLASSIWHLGRASVAQYVKVAPAPARVKGEIRLGADILEPEFMITNPASFHETIPDVVGLTVNSAEDFSPDTAFTLYTWRRIMLHTRRRTREFDKGVLIMDDKGNTITPQLDMPILGERRRPGTKVWRELTADTNIESFDVVMAQEFIDMTQRFHEHVVKNDSF